MYRMLLKEFETSSFGLYFPVSKFVLFLFRELESESKKLSEKAEKEAKDASSLKEKFETDKKDLEKQVRKLKTALQRQVEKAKKQRTPERLQKPTVDPQVRNLLDP